MNRADLLPLGTQANEAARTPTRPVWVPKTLQSRLAALSFLLPGSAFRFSGCAGCCSWCLRDMIRLFGGSDTQAAGVVLYSLLDGLRRQTSWPAQLHEATAGNHGSGYLPILRCDDVRSGWGNTDLASDATRGSVETESKGLQTALASRRNCRPALSSVKHNDGCRGRRVVQRPLLGMGTRGCYSHIAGPGRSRQPSAR